jgi:DNA-binding MarR family transcriptional regulator
MHRITIYFNGIMKNPEISDAQYETLAAFRYSLRQFLHFSEQAAASVGLTAHQHQALLAIKGFPKHENANIGEFAERLQICPHSAVGLANRLALKNLVHRKRDHKDRRQIHLALTRRGEKLLEKLSTAHHEQLRRVGPQIESLLKRLRE